MSNWYPGQRIVAIKTCSDWKQGDEFTIHSIHQKPCGCSGLCFDLSIINKHPGPHMCCKCGHKWEDRKTFSREYEHYFAPLEEIEASIAELGFVKQSETL